MENQRYALHLGMCKGDSPFGWDYKYLGTVQTRTSWFWHLYYGIAGT